MDHHTYHLAHSAIERAKRTDGAEGAVLAATGAGITTAKVLALTGVAVPVLAPVALPAAAVAAVIAAVWGWRHK